jgi:hypothetical protein
LPGKLKQKHKTTIMKKSIAIFILSICFGLGMTGCGSSNSTTDSKMSLEDQEKATPASYITVAANYDHDAIGESSIEGSLTNKATIADYKDVVIRVDFYNKDKAVIGNQTVTVNESIPSGETKLFKAKFRTPDGTENVNWVVLGATPY